MTDLVKISKNLLKDCLALKPKEQLLVLTDDTKEDLAQNMYKAGKALGATALLIKMPTMKKSGQEPPKVAAKAMASSDVVVCITEHSVTHTKAKKNAAENGARIATMPGITREMFQKGAITADYLEVENLTKEVADILTKSNRATIEKEGYKLEIDIEGRTGIESPGRYTKKGQAGNLPSGEAYIAPVEGKSNGQILVDGSIVGAGKLNEPILLTIKDGLLINAEGKGAKEWLEILGESKAARNLAEFGIGTNSEAQLTGNILEDEKILGTIHVAFGSNDTFGGKVSAGVHLDAVVVNPTVHLDDRTILDEGKLQLK